jgi:GrpB-like predicted nucleotidyltransferase (UPF0157 family)
VSTEKMRFVERDPIAREIAQAYATQREIVRSLVPRSRIRHIGSTAIPGSITKGDIDLLVSVASDLMSVADSRLSTCFHRNKGSGRSATFSSFVGYRKPFHIGVQLVARGSADEREFLTVQTWLARPSVVKKYNSLKRKFEGRSASAYRKAKTAFIERGAKGNVQQRPQ